MADNTYYVNKDILDFLIKIDRPVHKSICLKKVLCAHDGCGGKNDFFDENGISHHFRIKHKRQFTTSDRVESLRLSRLFHEQETRDCIKQIFDQREATKVSNTKTKLTLQKLTLL